MAGKHFFKKCITCLLSVLIFFHICQIVYQRKTFERNQEYSSVKQNEDLNVNKLTEVSIPDKLIPQNLKFNDMESNTHEVPEVTRKGMLFTNTNKEVLDETDKQSDISTTTTIESTTKSVTTQKGEHDEQNYGEKQDQVGNIKTKAEEIEEAVLKWNSLNEQVDTAIHRSSTYKAHDLMKDRQIEFDPNLKNPCWYEQKDADGKGTHLRCLPYVFLIGVKKCGTSDLFFRLSLHPDFEKAGFKEAQWFARKRFRQPTSKYDNFNEYINMFNPAALNIEMMAQNTSRPYTYEKITGEGSPSNLHLNNHWMNLPGNEGTEEPKFVILDYIHHFLPNAKILIVFRDPVDRLYSDYYHEYGTLMPTNNPNPYQFHMIVTEGIQLYKNCFQHHSVRSCVYNPTLNQKTRVQIQLGIYYIYWEDLTRLYPRNQILVLQNANLRDKKQTMPIVYNFLEMRTLSETEMYKVINDKEAYQRKASYKDQGPMLNTTLDILYEFYRPFNEQMAELTGDQAFLYKHDRT